MLGTVGARFPSGSSAEWTVRLRGHGKERDGQAPGVAHARVSPLLVATVALTAAQLWPFAIITAAAAVVTMLWSRVVARRELGDEALRAEEEWKAAHGDGPR